MAISTHDYNANKHHTSHTRHTGNVGTGNVGVGSSTPPPPAPEPPAAGPIVSDERDAEAAGEVK